MNIIPHTAAFAVAIAVTVSISIVVPVDHSMPSVVHRDCSQHRNPEFAQDFRRRAERLVRIVDREDHAKTDGGGQQDTATTAKMSGDRVGMLGSMRDLHHRNVQQARPVKSILDAGFFFLLRIQQVVRFVRLRLSASGRPAEFPALPACAIAPYRY